MPDKSLGANLKTASVPPGNADKDPADRVSGDNPMTSAQASYLKTLCEETGRGDSTTISRKRTHRASSRT